MRDAEALSITRLEGSRWRGGRLWSRDYAVRRRYERLERGDGGRDVAVGEDPRRHQAVGAVLIEATLRVRADRYHYVLAHVDQTATDGEASADREVSKAIVRAN